MKLIKWKWPLIIYSFTTLFCFVDRGVTFIDDDCQINPSLILTTIICAMTLMSLINCLTCNELMGRFGNVSAFIPKTPLYLYSYH